MIAGIIGVPARKDIIKDLANTIEPSVDKLEIFMDYDRYGTWWNQARAIEKLTSEARPSEPVIIMTDDVITVADWRERWEQIHLKAQNTIYTLFSRQRFLFKPENINRGFITKCQAKGFYDQAMIFIDEPNFMQSVQTWFDGGGKNHPAVAPRKKHLDVVIQEYLIAHNKPWTITTPTLFDHREVKSTLGHAVGKSPYYIGGS
jgi:hypothetical protein